MGSTGVLSDGIPLLEDVHCRTLSMLRELEGDIQKALTLLSDTPRIDVERETILYSLLCLQQAILYEERANRLLFILRDTLKRKEEGNSPIGATVGGVMELSVMEETVPPLFRVLLSKWLEMDDEDRDSDALRGQGTLPLWGETGAIEALAFHAGALIESGNPLVGLYGGLAEVYEAFRQNHIGRGRQ
jgi:hypothetical protein